MTVAPQERNAHGKYGHQRKLPIHDTRRLKRLPILKPNLQGFGTNTGAKLFCKCFPSWTIWISVILSETLVLFNKVDSLTHLFSSYNLIRIFNCSFVGLNLGGLNSCPLPGRNPVVIGRNIPRLIRLPIPIFRPILPSILPDPK